MTRLPPANSGLKQFNDINIKTSRELYEILERHIDHCPLDSREVRRSNPQVGGTFLLCPSCMAPERNDVLGESLCAF
jgi:hypothetical protein